MVSEKQITLTDFEKITGISNQTLSRAISQGKIPQQFVVKTGKRRPVFIQPKAAAVTWLKNLQGTTAKVHDLRKRLEAYIKTFIEEKEVIETHEHKDKSEKGVTSYAEAQRQERVFKAQLAELELEEKRGTLINKSEVYFQLFAIGKEIRTSLLAIADRITDDCFASQNRNKVHSLIYEAIEFELRRLSDLTNEKIG